MNDSYTLDSSGQPVKCGRLGEALAGGLAAGKQFMADSRSHGLGTAITNWGDSLKRMASGPPQDGIVKGKTSTMMPDGDVHHFLHVNGSWKPVEKNIHDAHNHGDLFTE